MRKFFEASLSRVRGTRMKNKMLMITKQRESKSILAPINNAFQDKDKNTGEIIAHLAQYKLA